MPQRLLLCQGSERFAKRAVRILNHVKNFNQFILIIYINQPCFLHQTSMNIHSVYLTPSYFVFRAQKYKLFLNNKQYGCKYYLNFFLIVLKQRCPKRWKFDPPAPLKGVLRLRRHCLNYDFCPQITQIGDGLQAQITRIGDGLHGFFSPLPSSKGGLWLRSCASHVET